MARKLIFLSPQHFPHSVVRSLVAIADGDYKESDRLKKVCLAALCELSVFNPQLFLACNGAQVITRNLLDTSMPKISEALLGALLRLYSDPELRAQADIHLDNVVAPFTEFHYIHDDAPPVPGAAGALSANELAEQDRLYRFQCAHQGRTGFQLGMIRISLLCYVFVEDS